MPLAGIAAACVVTFFTFLPSFMFILAGGPVIETTHGQLKFTAPLTGITAAVVGVIVNLAGFFAWHVFWPGGWRARRDARRASIRSRSPSRSPRRSRCFRYKVGRDPRHPGVRRRRLGCDFAR